MNKVIVKTTYKTRKYYCFTYNGKKYFPSNSESKKKSFFKEKLKNDEILLEKEPLVKNELEPEIIEQVIIEEDINISEVSAQSMNVFNAPTKVNTFMPISEEVIPTNEKEEEKIEEKPKKEKKRKFKSLSKTNFSIYEEIETDDDKVDKRISPLINQDGYYDGPIEIDKGHEFKLKRTIPLKKYILVVILGGIVLAGSVYLIQQGLTW